MNLWMRMLWALVAVVAAGSSAPANAQTVLRDDQARSIASTPRRSAS